MNIYDSDRVKLMSTWEKADILRLSVPERIQIVEDIWDSIAEVPHEIPVTEAQRAELDRRLDAYHENPAEGSSWEEVKKRIRGRK